MLEGRVQGFFRRRRSHPHERGGFSLSSLRGLCLAFFILSAPLCVSAQSVLANRDDALREARADVEARHYDAALGIFRHLAEQNPRDLEARNWVARLESWKGNYRQAEELYRGVLRDTGGDLEAELGLTDVLAWQRRYTEAMDRLHGLRNRYPSEVEVLLRLGRFSLWQHHPEEALWHYREVLSVDSGNAEARRAVRLLTEQKPFRLEAGYYLEDYDFADNTNGQFIELLYQNYDRVTFLGRFQYQNKFGQNNTRVTLGTTYRFWQKTWLRGEFSWAPPSNTVIPNQDLTVELTQGVGRRFAAGGSYRFLNFRDAQVHVPSALVNWDPRSGLHLYVRYTPARTHFYPLARNVWNQGGWTRLEWDATRHFSPYVLFAMGAESFAAVSTDQLGRFSAQTYGAGAMLRFTPTQGLRLGYFYQNRTQGHHEQSFGVSYLFSF